LTEWLDLLVSEVWRDVREFGSEVLENGVEDVASDSVSRRAWVGGGEGGKGAGIFDLSTSEFYLLLR
jgi:hypothetical protein